MWKNYAAFFSWKIHWPKIPLWCQAYSCNMWKWTWEMWHKKCGMRNVVVCGVGHNIRCKAISHENHGGDPVWRCPRKVQEIFVELCCWYLWRCNAKCIVVSSVYFVVVTNVCILTPCILSFCILSPCHLSLYHLSVYHLSGYRHIYHCRHRSIAVFQTQHFEQRQAKRRCTTRYLKPRWTAQ